MTNILVHKAAAADHSERIDAGNRFKNEAISKSHLSRVKLFILGLVLTGASVYAQDIITMRNGNEIRAKVTELTPSEIRYKRFENIEGPTVVVRRAEVFAITYENGTREVINAVTATTTEQPTRTSVYKHTPFYAGIVGGYGILGPVIGIKAGYFFTEKLGAGLTYRRNTWSDWYDYGNTSVIANYIGTAFYGHWGRTGSKFFFPTAVGFGIATYEEAYGYGSEKFTNFAMYISQGVAYRFVELCSAGINFNLGGGSLVAFTLGVNFHF